MHIKYIHVLDVYNQAIQFRNLCKLTNKYRRCPKVKWLAVEKSWLNFPVRHFRQQIAIYFRRRNLVKKLSFSGINCRRNRRSCNRYMYDWGKVGAQTSFICALRRVINVALVLQFTTPSTRLRCGFKNWKLPLLSFGDTTVKENYVFVYRH